MTKKTAPYKAQITVLDGYAMVATPGKAGQGIVSKPVTLDSLAMAFSGIPVSTGMLPDGALFFTQVGKTVFTAVFIPPGVHVLRTPERTYQVPLPGMVFAGHDRTYELYALADKARPNEESLLYYPPLPNIFNNGAVCQGDMAFPECTPGNIWNVWEQNIIGSYFTGHMASGRTKSGGNIFDVWANLEKRRARRFPVDELLLVSPKVTLGQLAGRSA